MRDQEKTTKTLISFQDGTHRSWLPQDKNHSWPDWQSLPGKNDNHLKVKTGKTNVYFEPRVEEWNNFPAVVERLVGCRLGLMTQFS